MNLYYCSVNDIKSADINYYAELLPSQMGRYVRKFFAEEDKKHRLLARLMLRYCLIQTTGNDTLLHDWQLDTNKKPIIKNWFRFSISHSGDFVLFGYGTGCVGVDIEKVESIDYMPLADYFHASEKKYIESATDKMTSFYTIWVKKEAMLKAIGSGIVSGLQEFSCVDEYVFYNNQLWFFHRVEINPNYVCYYCDKQPHATCEVNRFNILNIS
jgi:4'-phosphopantetheinyl transferase